MPDNFPWLLILNPNAGKSRGRKIFTEIEYVLKKLDIDYEPVFTESKGHASTLVYQNIKKGFRKIIVAGGDGSINEVVNGIFMQKEISTAEISLAVIPTGTGNDWIRTYNIPKNIEFAATLIKKGKTTFQDIGLVKFYERGEARQHYFINNAGVGFDAYVVEQTNKKKETGSRGSFMYLFSLFRYLQNYKNLNCSLTIDDTLFHGKVLSICAGMGKYNGGGMMPLPESVLDDGLFDITVFTDIKKIEVLLYLKKLYNGQIYSVEKVKKFTGKNIRIETESICSIETDGELLGHGPFVFEIIPKSIKVISGL